MRKNWGLIIILVLIKINMQAQKKYTNNSFAIISVNPEIYRYNPVSERDYNSMIKELLHSLSTIKANSNSLSEYYREAGLYRHSHDNYFPHNIKDILLNAQSELKNNKPITEKEVIISYYLRYKYLNKFKDLWYGCPHQSLRLSDNYLTFFEKIPSIEGKDFFMDSTVLTDFFDSNIQFSLEEAFLGGMAVDLDMYLVQLDKKVCSEILKLKIDCPVNLKVENEMFFDYMKAGATEQSVILVAYF